MKLKKFIYIFLLFILIFLCFTKRNEILIYFMNYQHKIMKDLIYNIKNENLLFAGILIYLYGIIHSLGPGHGKIFLLGLKSKKNKLNLIFYSYLIAYIQGLVSFIIIYFVFNDIFILHKFLKNINNLSQSFYGIALIILGGFNIINEILEKHIRNEISIFGLFLPCSGVLSVLVSVVLLGYKKYLFFTTLIMSTGIFTTLLIFIFFINKIKIKKINPKISQIIENIFYILLIILGIYFI